MTDNETTPDLKQHILVVDDDRDIRTLLGEYLNKNGYAVSLAQDGTAMQTILDESTIDLIILDVMLPGTDGYSLCRQIRQYSNIPIIMLTAIGEEVERIVGLETGADDYMSKPFNPRELLARIKAVLRRSASNSSRQPSTEKRNETITPKSQTYCFEGWLLNKQKRTLTSPEKLEVLLTSGEFDLLVTFLENPQIVLSRDQLLTATKNREAGPFDRSIDIQISRLRGRIEQDPKKPKMIKTVRGGGYMLTSSVKRQTAN